MGQQEQHNRPTYNRTYTAKKQKEKKQLPKNKHNIAKQQG